MSKRSFFERLTGAVRIEDEDTLSHEERVISPRTTQSPRQHDADWVEEPVGDAELTIDMYETPNDIILKTMVAGVRPEDLDISITRDMVTIRGSREEDHSIEDNDYFHRELYWGSFSRSIVLPKEVEVDEAEAVEKHGLLIITLPKIDKARQTKLKVKS